jgi:hypothetical protein
MNNDRIDDSIHVGVVGLISQIVILDVDVIDVLAGRRIRVNLIITNHGWTE